MKDFAILPLLLLLLVACNSSENKEIDTNNIKDSANRTFSAQVKKRIHFYNTDNKVINSDQFNRLLAGGAYVSRQHINDDGSENIHLVSTIDHSKSLEGTFIPDFKIDDIKGKTYTRQDLIGKTTILTFWMTASFVCAQELNSLNSLRKEYKNERDFLWLAPALDPSTDLSRFLRNKNNLGFTFFSGQEKLAQKIGLLTYPTHLIIDKKGQIKRAIVRQPESKIIIRKTLEQLL